MDLINQEKFKRLSDTVSRNYRVTRLYAQYLERFPDVITEDMVKALTEGGDMTVKEALVGILTELFALDYDLPEDRKIIRDYLTPSVVLLNAEKYRSNPYYKNVRITDIKDGNWELRWERYPAYRGVIAGDMTLLEDFTEIPPLGFFTEDFDFPAVLEGGNEWMTLTPVDLDTCEEAIFAARGRVITFGLGLGYYAYMVSEKPEVESVTVVEKSPEVIKLFKKHILPQFKNKDKVKIVEADAFEYAEKVMPRERYDLAFVDTWRDSSDGAPMYLRMKPLEKLNTGTRFMYWIENFLISRVRALRLGEMLDKIDEGSPDAPKSYNEIIEKLTVI